MEALKDDKSREQVRRSTMARCKSNTLHKLSYKDDNNYTYQVEEVLEEGLLEKTIQ